MVFFKYRREIIQFVREHGGMYELYKHFVDLFINDGFQLRELTNDSLYIHYGTEEGKIGIQIIQVSKEKIEIIVGEELPFKRRNSYKISASIDFPTYTLYDKIISSLKLVKYPVDLKKFQQMEQFEENCRQQGMSERETEYETNKKYLTWDDYINNVDIPIDLITAIKLFFIPDNINAALFYENINIIENDELGILIDYSTYYPTNSLKYIKKVPVGFQTFYLAAYPDVILWLFKEQLNDSSEIYEMYEKLVASQVHSKYLLDEEFQRVLIDEYKFYSGKELECILK